MGYGGDIGSPPPAHPQELLETGFGYWLWGMTHPPHLSQSSWWGIRPAGRPPARPPGRPPPTGLLLEHHEIHTFALRRRTDFLGDPGLGS